MSIKVPNFKEPGLTEWLVALLQSRDEKQGNFLLKGTANQSLLLMSPNKKVFEIKVSDAGALTATQVG